MLYNQAMNEFKRLLWRLAASISTSSSLGEAGAKLRRGDPRIHAGTLAAEAAEQNLQRSVAQKSRHGSSGLRRVATLLASPVEDDGIGVSANRQDIRSILQMR
ncbi:hypothetical protein X771_01605 [Mesorhizobium sp. LSJC277A00]|nr:hypothetical protein X771_01605 [Mesorhizobium sp. LSJC277A00]